MEIPDGVSGNRSEQVCILKAIYGFTQSAKAWYKVIESALMNLKLKKTLFG